MILTKSHKTYFSFRREPNVACRVGFVIYRVHKFVTISEITFSMF